MKRFNRVHAICSRLRNKPCELCPARTQTPYGRAVLGCYALAREVVDIALHGNPYGPRAKPPEVRHWRKHFNKE